MLRFLGSSLVLAAAAIAFASDDLPDGVGVVTPSGSVFTTEITTEDSDDYVFQGYPGMKLTATVKLAKGSFLVPQVQIIRPGGTLVGDEDGLSVKTKPTSVKATVALDAVGWWKVRVSGADGSTGAYSVSVKYTSPALSQLPATSKGFTAGATIESWRDDDTFAFQGYDGQSLQATLIVPTTSALDPAVQVIRPDGSVLATAGSETNEATLGIEQTLDASGTWHIKVVGEEASEVPSTGAYVLTVKLGRVTAPGMTPDGNGQYRFTIPAAAGATISYKLTTGIGQPPVFNSIVGPDGVPVTGFVGGAALKPYKLAEGLPFGLYTVTFDAPVGPPPADVRVTRSVVPPKSGKKRAAKLSASEPLIVGNDAINPVEGGPGTMITVRANGLVDPLVVNGAPTIELGRTPLEAVAILPGGLMVRGRVPASLPVGVYDVVVTSTSGQPAVRANAFEIVPPPTLLAFDPPFGSVLGGGEITLTGRDLRSPMGLLFDGTLQPVTATYADATTLRFPIPTHAGGFVTVGVVDLRSNLRDELRSAEFEFVTTPVITRVTPAIVAILGGETVTLDGVLFAPDDSVFLETTTPGSYEELTVTQTTYVSGTRHRFVTPVRPRGDYRVHVIDAQGRPNPPKARTLTYFDIADVTAASGFGTSLADSGDAVTSAVFDVDGDGDLDLALARSGGATAAATPQTRVFRNDGHGAFSDATAAVMPPAGSDDWRADRIVAADMDADGRTDLVLTTNSLTVPPSNSSHTRLLMNERRGGTGPDADQRVLRDRTIDLMAPVRTMKRYGVFGGNNATYVSDDWRGLDVWVGDLDASGSGRPEIVLTHDEVKNDDNPSADVFTSGVYCGNYCSSAQAFPYSYSFYWGGSRTFVWDKSARAGLGRYKFEPNYFPRKAGPVVPQYLPGGFIDPACSSHYSRICKGSFTPFTGKRLAVGDLNADGKLDVAVVSEQIVQRRDKPNDPLHAISSLQVGLNKFNAAEGSLVTDVTAKLTALGADFKGDAVAIGHPDGGPYGTIALGRTAGPLRLLRWFDAAGTLSVSDVSADTLPVPLGADALQAGQLRFVDVDKDGDEDLVLLAPASPGGTQAALRFLLNDGPVGTSGVFVRRYDELVEDAVLPGDPFEGAALSIGDLSGDGLPEFAVSRPQSGGQGAETRILSIQR